MKLIKKITTKRAKTFKEYELVQKKFNEIKNSENTQSGISRTDTVDELNFFIVVEYINVADRIDYLKIFPKDDFIVDIEGLLNEQYKIIQHINKRKNDYSECFYKLGLINEVTGVYFIATRKSDVKYLSMKNTKNTISIKFDAESLPKEIEQMCFDYHESNQNAINKEKDEFDRFNKLSYEEYDIILINILQNVNTGSVDFFYYPDNKKTKNNQDVLLTGNTSVIKKDDAFLQNLEKVTNKNFLKSLLDKAVLNENYELCAKIRDRISFLS